MLLEHTESFGTLERRMKITLDLPVDPALQQTFAHQVTLEATTRTAADLHRLNLKRQAPRKPTLRDTREQRAHDALHKLLPPNTDMLTHMRRLAVGNYFVVPASQAVAVRNMTHRELKERGIKYTTNKFIYGRNHCIKVQRHNPAND